MKKVLVFCMCLVLLTGCNRAGVGIIGGSDGPTAIIVGGEKSMQGVKMIRVDGELYYDTGKDSALIPRCGTLDGSLKNIGVELDVPQNDGESNFETSGYQNATGMAKEVPLEGNWRIFKRIDTSKDSGKYKYVLRLKGRHPNAVRDSEFIVLTNDLSVDFDSVSKSLFSSQSTDWIDCCIIPVLDEEKWGIRLWAEGVTKTGLAIVFEQFGGKAEGDLRTGSWYGIERMNDDYEWEKVSYLPTEYPVSWNSIAYNIRKNDRTEFEVNWEKLYGELPQGHYRIGKKVMDLKGAGDFEEDVYYADFFIE